MSAQNGVVQRAVLEHAFRRELVPPGPVRRAAESLLTRIRAAVDS